MDPNTRGNYWENLPTWHEAKDKGFPLYRATNDSYMEMIKNGNAFKTGEQKPFRVFFPFFMYLFFSSKCLPYLEQFSYGLETEKSCEFNFWHAFTL